MRVRSVLPRSLSCAAALLVLVSPPARAAASAAAVLFESTSVDFGSVIQGEHPAVDFSFRNVGAAELRILRIEPACGCTSALLASHLVPPGGRGTIHVTFDSSNFSGDVLKQIAVETSDPAKPLVTLALRARVEPEVSLDPGEITFDNARPGAGARQLAMLTNRRAEPVRIERVAAHPATFACRVGFWPGADLPLVVESWERVPIEVDMAAPSTFAMPVPGECTLAITGPRKALFTLKLLALPVPRP